jgi:hypothetical protein
MLTLGRRVSVVGCSCAVAALVFATAGCAKQGTSVERANVVQHEMPEGGDFTGVYYDSYFGNLHLVREGDSVTGRWRTDNGDAWGELQGDIKGDILRFEWTEHKIGMVGASANTKGHGYFVYKRPEKDGDPDYIAGERGVGNKEAGQKWKGIKQHNVAPNLQSVTPDEYENRGTGGGWDEDENKPKGGGGKAKKSKATSDEESGDEEKAAPSKAPSKPKPKSGDNGDTDY